MDISSLTKRGAPSFEPHELTVITDEIDPLFDRRIYLPISDEAILNLAAVGQVQPVAVRTRGLDDVVIVDGLQRWKRATVINHLTGRREYDGNINAIIDAIVRLAAHPTGRRILELCPTGMKLRVSLFRADDKEAQRAKASANEFREADPIAEKARKAQQMNRHGIEETDIASSFGVTEQTIRRWLAMSLDAPKVRKKRGKATRPGPKRLKKVGDVLAEFGFRSAAVVVRWARGEISEDEMISVLEVGAAAYEAIKAPEKRKAA